MITNASSIQPVGSSHRSVVRRIKKELKMQMAEEAKQPKAKDEARLKLNKRELGKMADVYATALQGLMKPEGWAQSVVGILKGSKNPNNQAAGQAIAGICKALKMDV